MVDPGSDYAATARRARSGAGISPSAALGGAAGAAWSRGRQERPVLERVHRLPESVVAVADQLVLGEQPLERLRHELLAVSQVVEDLGLENEMPAVHPQAGLRDIANARHLAAGSRQDEVITQLRLHAEKARDPVVPPEMLELRRHRHIRG